MKLANAPIVVTKFLELAMSLLDFSPRISLGTFSILPFNGIMYVFPKKIPFKKMCQEQIEKVPKDVRSEKSRKTKSGLENSSQRLEHICKFLKRDGTRCSEELAFPAGICHNRQNATWKPLVIR